MEIRSEFRRLVQLLVVKLRPFADEPKRAWRQRALDNLQCIDCDLRNVFAVNRVKVSWRMIAVIKLNDDAVEAADLR